MAALFAAVCAVHGAPDLQALADDFYRAGITTITFVCTEGLGGMENCRHFLGKCHGSPGPPCPVNGGPAGATGLRALATCASTHRTRASCRRR